MTVATMPGWVEASVRLPALRDDRHQLVAVDDMAFFVDDQHAVGVAVERDADIGAHFAHFGGERFGRGRADVAVDVEAVGLDADREHLGAEFPQSFGRDLIGGAVGAIDDDAQAFEREIARQSALGEFDIAGVNAFDALGAAEVARFRQARRDLTCPSSASISASISSDSL